MFWWAYPEVCGRTFTFFFCQPFRARAPFNPPRTKDIGPNHSLSGLNGTEWLWPTDPAEIRLRAEDWEKPSDEFSKRYAER